MRASRAMHPPPRPTQPRVNNYGSATTLDIILLLKTMYQIPNESVLEVSGPRLEYLSHQPNNLESADRQGLDRVDRPRPRVEGLKMYLE